MNTEHINAALRLLRDMPTPRPAFFAVLDHLESALEDAEDAAVTERNLRRSLWLVVEAAGGKVSVARSLQESFDAERAVLRFGTDPDSKTLDFWTEKKP